MHDAFAAGLERWPHEGVPANPRSWLISTGRHKAIDGLRRRARFDASQDKIADQLLPSGDFAPAEVGTASEESVPDDQLRLIFTCCHPALAPEGRLALTLREVCGLTTEEIASAFSPLRRRWRSGSCGPRRRSVTSASRIKCLRQRSCRSVWMRCCRWCISCLTRAIPPPQAPRSPGRNSLAKPSAWGVCCWICSRSRRAWACSPHAPAGVASGGPDLT